MQYLKHSVVDYEHPDISLPKKAIKNVPTGFSPYKVKGKTWFHCSYTQDDKRCCIHISSERFSKLTPNEKQQVIQHRHELPSIELYFGQADPHHDNEVTRVPNIDGITALEKKIHLLIGKMNLPLSFFTSELFIDILHEAFYLGASHPMNCASSFIKLPGRTAGTKHFINIAAIIFEDLLSQYQQIQYVGIALDAGKVSTSNYLDVYIMNTNTKLKPLLIKSFKNFAGDTEAYKNAIQIVMRELLKLHLVAVGFVADNLRVQMKVLKEAGQHYGIPAISCGCHNLNLALHDTARFNNLFENFYNKIIAVSQVLTKKKTCNILDLSCPQYVETRWIILFDISLWIVRHSQEIIAMLTSPHIIPLIPLYKHIENLLEVVFEVAPRMVLILLPLKLLCNKLEADGTSMSEVYAYVRSAQLVGASLINSVPDCIPIFNTINEKVISRCTKSEAGCFQMSIFSLTAKGRMAFKCYAAGDSANEAAIYREKFQLNLEKYRCDIDLSYSILNQCKIGTHNGTEIKNTIVTMIRSQNNTFSLDCSFLTGRRCHQYLTNDARFSIVNDDEEWRTYESHDDTVVISHPRPVPEGAMVFETPEDETTQMLDQSIQESELDDDIIGERPYNSFDIMHQIRKYASRFGFDPDLIAHLYVEFFTDDRIEDLYMYSWPSTNALWTFLKSTEFEPLIAFAEIFSATSAAEAIAERGFSDKRDYVCDDRAKSGQPLVSARKTYRSDDLNHMYHILRLRRFIQ